MPRASRYFTVQSVQLPAASQLMHVVPSSTFSVFAASSTVTLAFET